MNLKRLKEKLRHIAHLDETPETLAKSFAAGIFVAFSPAIGFHTALILLLAWGFRLNKLVALTGTFVNNPWTIAFVYLGPTWAAIKAMRYMGIPVRKMNYDMVQQKFTETLELYSVWQASFWAHFLQVFKPYIRAFMWGTLLASFIASIISYYVVLYGVRYYRCKRHGVCAPAKDKKETA